MDVYIPEEYVIQRRLEKRNSASAAANKLNRTSEKGRNVFQSNQKERKVASGQQAQSSCLVQNNDYIYTTNSVGLGENVVFTCFSA